MSAQDGTTYGTRFVFTLTGQSLYAGTGTPEGAVTGSVGDVYVRLDASGSVPAIYTKLTGAATNTGWVALLGAGVGAPLDAPIFTTSATVGLISSQDVLKLLPVNSATRFTGTLTPADLTADRLYIMPNASGTLLIAMYGGMYQYTGVGATVIATAAEYYALTQMVTGLQQGFTFIGGSGGGAGLAISAVADAGSGRITVTTANSATTNAWSVGQPVTIHGTTDYDGAYLIYSTADATHFVITKAYTQTRTGVARGACALKANTGTAGTFEIGFTASATSAGNSKAWRIEANRNTDPLDNIASRAQSSANSTARTLSGLGHATVADGDVIWLSMYNETDATNITVNMVNMTVKRIGS